MRKTIRSNWKPYVKEWLQRHGISGDIVVLTEGPSTKHPDANHRMEIIDLRSSGNKREEIDSCRAFIL